MLTDPGDLLDKHCYLLEEDFEQLGEGASGVREQWIASMESALKAADHIRSGRRIEGSPGTFSPVTRYSNILRLSSNGSFVYKRGRRRRAV